MRIKTLLFYLALLLPASHAAAAPAVIEYSGRVLVAGAAFSGKGQFKFALIDPSGKRLWTSGDGEAPIEAGIPSGTVPLAVTRGVYQVRLGDPAAGMPPLTPELTEKWNSLQIQTWFDDGSHGWAEAGLAGLSGQGPAPRALAPAGASVLGEPTDADTLQTILLEVRKLRSEVSLLRKQVSDNATAPTPARPSPAPVASVPSKATPTPPPVPAMVSLADVPRHSLGSADAPVVLVEFTDFECGFCKRFFDQTLPQLKEKYIDTGKLRFVSRNFPVPSHPQAGPAAQALLSTAAQDPDQYWLMRAWLFGNNRDLNDVAYGTYVKEAGLDVPRFVADYTTKRHGTELDEDLAAGRAVGITGTPSFVLGTSDGKTIHGERVVGAKSFEALASKIEALLKPQAGDAPAPAPAAAETPETPETPEIPTKPEQAK